MGIVRWRINNNNDARRNECGGRRLRQELWRGSILLAVRQPRRAKVAANNLHSPRPPIVIVCVTVSLNLVLQLKRDLPSHSETPPIRHYPPLVQILIA
jgi:hypothetical protein